jgi:hypothetical protein
MNATYMNVQHGDMNAGTKLAALNKFRNSTSILMRQSVTKVLVVYDVQVKTPEVAHIPLIINYGKSTNDTYGPILTHGKR